MEGITEVVDNYVSEGNRFGLTPQTRQLHTHQLYVSPPVEYADSSPEMFALLYDEPVQSAVSSPYRPSFARDDAANAVVILPLYAALGALFIGGGAALLGYGMDVGSGGSGIAGATGVGGLGILAGTLGGLFVGGITGLIEDVRRG